jgi:hypothetical protein
MKKNILFLLFILLFFTFTAHASLYPDIQVNTENKFKKSIENHLGKWNLNENHNRLDVIKMLSHDSEDDTIGIGFLVNDNLSKNMIIGGIEKDIADLFKITVDNYKNINKYKNLQYVLVMGYSSVIDDYGNNSLGTVAQAIIEMDKLEKINWNNFFNEDFKKISLVYKINLNGL